MLVNTLASFKSFLPAVNLQEGFELYIDAIEVAQDGLVNDILGEDLEKSLEDLNPEDEKLLRLCQRAISLEAFLKSIPEMDLMLTEAGFAVRNNDQMAPASTARINALKESLANKLDAAKDRLTDYLFRTSRYDDWRGTEQFARLSDGLIMTLTEFRDVAVKNERSLPMYPKSWQDFIELNPALNVALMTKTAAYISRDFAEELIEKIRDKEILTAAEKTVLKIVKTAIAAYAMGDDIVGDEQSIKARNMMKAAPDDFPAFNSSAEAAELDFSHEDTPIFSML